MGLIDKDQADVEKLKERLESAKLSLRQAQLDEDSARARKRYWKIKIENLQGAIDGQLEFEISEPSRMRNTAPTTTA